MAPFPRLIPRVLVAASLLALAAIAKLPASTISQQLSPGAVTVGQPATITLTLRGGNVNSGQSSSIFGVTLPTVDISLPEVDGIRSAQTGMNITVGNGNATTVIRYTLIASRSGIFTIPAFDVTTRSGEVLHVKAMALRVLDNANTPVNAHDSPELAATSSAPTSNPSGPVVMPPQTSAPPSDSAPANSNTAANGNTANSAPPEVSAPRDPDGGPAKVFIIITPQTTDAYVGQAIPMEIDFYIRMDVNADQNSLPTIKGSDFLMNNFTTRGHVTLGLVEQQQYMRETWITAISAPKSGDFPLDMQRDTYWVKSLAPADNSIFGNYFSRRANLAHEMIGSNLVTMHIHELPVEGRPDHFSGAIGQLKVTGQSEPSKVSVGEPVHLRFTVSGYGNFDYVRSPVLSEDPDWKAYVPTSQTRFASESHADALKVFDQSIIPQKSGVLPLPEASFSYFDPTTKQYVTVPISLPQIVVTGSDKPVAVATPASGNDVSIVAAPTPTVEMLPNRLEIGSTRSSLIPAFRQAWFWAVQVGLIALPLSAAVLVLLRFRSKRAEDARAAHATHEHSLQQEQDVMADSVRRGDARAFFTAARHAVQMRLGSRWNVSPEALTLHEIRARDPQLAETLEDLFRQADEAIYSGHSMPYVDLVKWERRVRTELLQPQPA